jgi:hypothetical protein
MFHRERVKSESAIKIALNSTMQTDILFSNIQEIDIWKSYVASNSSSENWTRKQRQNGWGFLNLNLFECVIVTRCKRFSCHSKLRKSNIEESVVDQKVVAVYI